MKIELAQSYGFCFGVKRAIKIAQENKNSATYGALIHNTNEINRLKKDFNVALIEDIKEFKSGDTAVIRTHGIPKNELSELVSKDVNVIDATCPYVTKPQQIVEQMSSDGYDIVIFGDSNHPEIKGVKSYVDGNVYVVNSLDELDNIKLRERVATVAQTTRKLDDYHAIVSFLMRHSKEVRVFNTICNATFDNQDAARDLAKKADIMIVIGGKNSSNTKQLYAICKEYCDDSYHIEDKDEINFDWFSNKEYCGISAGASTPDWIIDEVIEVIKNIKCS